ncbi:hypothetical protein C8J57DRAFT_1608521, partial [Mycena rebaudengoi]
LNARSLSAAIAITALKVSDTQRALIESMYAFDASNSFTTPPIIEHFFSTDTDAQIQAAAVMAQHGLDVHSREDLGSRWSHQWTRADKGKDGTLKRFLYLCSCGYDHTKRNTKNDREEHVGGSRVRHTALPFTGCVAHAEITVRSNTILRIRGHFVHNDECKDALVTRQPPMPIHPSVYAVALAQLRDGACFSDVRQKNRDLFKAGSYAEFPPDLHKSPFRWLLEHNDSRSLYRQYNRMKGINTTDAPQVNVDDWLDPKSEKFNAALAHAIFHYSGRAEKGDRFEACIATDEMNEAAWKYGHESQIILDGTFGVCDSRVLLFIVMAVDENRKGVPIAFLLFSAPTGNQQSSAGYNTDIIAKLVGKWKASLNKCAHLYGRGGIKFNPRCAITDTDLKERAALIRIFPDIWLLICRFHLRQSWRNHRNKVLKGKGQVFTDLKNRMSRLERDLTATQEISKARALLAAERKAMEKLLPDHPRSAQKSIDHIDYLNMYWTTENLWKSWSDHGRTVAAELMGCDVAGVLPTTNHLESFNGVLKRSHLRRWQKGGRRLRIDVLIHALIMHILPSIFEERRMYSEQNSRRLAHIRLLPGGEALLHGQRNQKIIAAVPKLAYFVPDSDRQKRGWEMHLHRQISAPVFMPDNAGLTLAAFSAQALSIDTDPVIYTIRVGFNGAVSCDCLDFKGRGGACKHIHGAFYKLEDLRGKGVPIPAIPIPQSLAEAQDLQAQV